MPYAEPNRWDFKPIHLTEKQIADPLLVIDWFFTEEVDLADAEKRLANWFQACFSEKCSLTVIDVIVLEELRNDIVKLMEAGNLLKGQAINCKLNGDDDLMNTAHFSNQASGKNCEWHYFPRHLDRKEYINPAKVFDRIFQFKNLPQWRDILSDYYSAAVSDCTILECTDGHNIFTGFQLIGKLLEASHLIKVRLIDKNQKLQQHY